MIWRGYKRDEHDDTNTQGFPNWSDPIISLLALKFFGYLLENLRTCRCPGTTLPTPHLLRVPNHGVHTVSLHQCVVHEVSSKWYFSSKVAGVLVVCGFAIDCYLSRKISCRGTCSGSSLSLAIHKVFYRSNAGFYGFPSISKGTKFNE